MTEIVVKKEYPIVANLQEVHSGTVFEEFLQSQKATPQKGGLSDMGAYNLRASTTDILNHCNPHGAVGNKETTHLVVGYVQSGKTMSFTGVLAMARDNGYRVAVILTGITTNLQGQTSDRLAHDLDCDSSEDRFSFLDNPSDDEADDVVKALRLSDKPMLIIPILKHKKYLNDLTKIFRNSKVKKAMQGETVLIIDDEADQASLNSFGYKNSNTFNAEEEKESATYAAILRLRAVLPGNSYIQYTATPQANLLIATKDLLSPKSHTLLIPGEDYIGGLLFFGLGKDGELFGGRLAVTIPPAEVFHKKQNVLKEMPQSLRDAIMMHVWAVILVIKWYKRPDIRQLTMMVHPTDIIDGNKVFEKWIRDELSLWSEALDKPSWHQSHVQLLEEFESMLPAALEFYPEEGRPQFEDVCRYIPDVVNDCRVYRITGDSKDDPTDIKWNAHRMNILVGAQMLNRGFTVEKLATTYMPRHSTGQTNADTIEQRCRFFGYKRNYIESCRAYLPADSIQDYKDYVRHEEELRTLLAQCSTLKEYEHSVMLSPRLRPTRQNVLPRKMVKSRLAEWNRYERLSGVKMLMENKATVETFVRQHLPDAHEFLLPAYDSHRYSEGDIKKHALKDVQMDELLALLSDYTAGNYSDTITKAATIRYLGYLSQNGLNSAKVIFMSRNLIRERSRQEEGDGQWRVGQLFQGRSNIGAADNYAGDINIYDPTSVTVQIHHLRILGLPVSESDRSETYILAVHIPEKLAAQYYTTLCSTDTL